MRIRCLFLSIVFWILACGPAVPGLKTEDDTGTETTTAPTDCVGAPDNDGDGQTACTDCNDADPSIYWGALELCDGVDNDCDRTTPFDEGVADAPVWYTDADVDEYGDDASAVSSCNQPAGTVSTGGDCDDGNAKIHPGAEEICDDPTDYNCDGSVGYADLDSDGYPACEECNDADASVNPSASEVCDGVDQDCNGEIDDNASDARTWYQDFDGDGYGNLDVTLNACERPEGYALDSTDCDDRNSDVNPGADEYCDGFTDEDCDGETDEDEAVDVATWYEDADNDGHGDATATDIDCDQPEGYVTLDDDCDDANNDRYPGNAEYCDSVDNDCDGVVDNGIDNDVDGDGYVAEACGGDDCDDADPERNPGEEDICDGADNDCDADVDEDRYDGVVDPSDYYGSGSTDDDGDGYTEEEGDCDDSRSDANPGNGGETCDDDDIDHDCDGVDDDGCDGIPACPNYA